MMTVTITPPTPEFLQAHDDYLYGVFGLEEGDQITVTAVGNNGGHSSEQVADAEGTVHSSFPTPDDGEVTLTVLQGKKVLAKTTFPIER
jgi:hypothetical protein